MKSKKKSTPSGPSVSVFEKPPELDKTKSTFWVGKGDFADDGAPTSGRDKRKSLGMS